jgi:TonB-dependent starch-binding outer membrane protein SusC
MKKKWLQQLSMACRFIFYGTLLQAFFPGSLLAMDGDAHIHSIKDVNVDVNVRNAKIEQVFMQIEKQTDFTFNYNPEDIVAELKLDLNLQNRSVSEILLEISRLVNVSFRQVNNSIIVKSIIEDTEVPKETSIKVNYQAINITGRVISSDSPDGLPGVNVVVKGTTQGTVTDIDGNYSIAVPGSESVLVYSSVGFLTEEVTVGNRSVINMSLTADITALEEIVVIGFGTQEKKDITGSISSVRGEALNEIPVPTFEQALAGRAAGVQVTTGSGIPGAGASIRVRGVGSTNNAEPLYVIDGIIIGNAAGGGQTSISPLALINPNDIESIDILKDASATAIYGARAGNGVVIITTKRGKEGTMKVNFDTFKSVNVLDMSNFTMLNGQQWAQYFDGIQQENGITTYPGQPFISRVLGGENFPQYDWFDYASRNGTIDSYNLSLNAGTEKSKYFTSLSYFKQNGILLNSDLERFTGRFNSDHQVSKRIKMGTNLALSRTSANTVGNVNGNSNTQDWITRTLGANPFKPIFDPITGAYAGSTSFDPDTENQMDNANQHVIWRLENQYAHQIRNRVWASLYTDIELAKGLIFHTMGSLDLTLANNENRNPANEIPGAAAIDQVNSSLSMNNSENRTWFVENTLQYSKNLSGHSFNVMLGYQAQNNLNKGFNAGAGAFVDTEFWFFDRPRLTAPIVDSEGNVIATVPQVFPSVGNFQNESAFVSVFSRAIYSYNDKYLLTATVRRDGSSRFGPQQRWGTFPAVSAGWRISEEDFMRSLNHISDMKLRVGYGISGSDNTALYQWNSRVGTGGNEEYVFDGGIIPGAILTRLANEFLSWEEIKMTNVGLDVALLKNRLEVTVDYFYKITEGLLLPFAPAFEVGAIQNPSGNLGRVDNRGWELTVNSTNIAKKDFMWTSNFNISSIRNEVVSLPENADRFNGINITRVGEEIGSIYGFKADGLFQNWDEVYRHAYQNQNITGFEEGIPIYSNNTDIATQRSNTAPGDVRFRDLNDDGIIDADNDRAIIGSTIPDFIWGLSNNLSYKGINLAILFQGVHGVNAYNELRLRQERSTGGWENKRTTVLNRWVGEGTSNSVPRGVVTDPNSNQRVSSIWVEDASFIRLKNIRLSYTLPANLMQSIGLQNTNINIYGVGTNLLTITNYTGFDPEIGLRNANNPETAGMDAGLVPLTRQFTLGLQVSF